jgi:tripeptide aminopeptidase
MNSLLRAAIPALFLLPAATRSLGSQERAGAPPAQLRAALDSARAHHPWSLDQQQSICEIPAPPFKEAARAAEMLRRFTALGLTRPRLDGIGNALAEYPGRSREPLIVLSAHLDTVFPEGTDVRVRREGSVLKGPGISDDCRGLAVLLVTARALVESRVPLAGTIVFAATVGEEGLGNGRGVRHLVERELPGQVDYFLTVDGPGFSVVNRAVGSRRYEVTFRGPGGHSFDHFESPHPVHALGRAIAKVSGFSVPADPRTTFNVGIVRGGTAVNAIAATASMVVDLRSESRQALDQLDARFREAVAEAASEEQARWPASSARLSTTWDTLGIRPGGIVADSSPLVRTADAAARRLGESIELGSSSTDANIPISLGIPALAVGHGGKGAGEHSLDELYDDGPRGYLGAQWLLLMAAGLDQAGPTRSQPAQSQPAQAQPAQAQGATPAAVQAVSLLGDTLRSFPLPPEVRARYERQLGEAEAAYRRAPTNPDSIIWLGRRLAYLGRIRDAIEVFTRGIALHPANPWLYRHRGHRYITVRELDLAIRDLERARTLVAGKPDEVEPDGQPNALNRPIGTLHSNILYHLGLAYYLKGDFARALPIYQREMAIATNDDRKVSTAHWLYMTLRRLGRPAEAARVLTPIGPKLDVIENDTYHRLLLLYKGALPVDSVLATTPSGEMSVTDATAAYGIGNWHLYSGRREVAREIFRRILAGGQWGAFGYIAAEAEMARWRQP